MNTNKAIGSITKLGAKNPIVAIIAIVAIMFFVYMAVSGGGSIESGNINQTSSGGDNTIKF